MPTVVFLHARPIVEMATAARLPTMLPADWENYRPLLTYGSSLIDGVPDDGRPSGPCAEGCAAKGPADRGGHVHQGR